MVEEFKKLFYHFKRVQNRYTHLLPTFWTFDSLEIFRAPNRVGSRMAQANVKILNSYRGFFFPIKEALRIHLLLELSKFFDKSHQAVHIPKLVSYAEENLSKLTKEYFFKFHASRIFLPESIAEYKPFNRRASMPIKRSGELNKSQKKAPRPSFVFLTQSRFPPSPPPLSRSTPP